MINLPMSPKSTVERFSIRTSSFVHKAVSFNTLKLALGMAPFTVKLEVMEETQPVVFWVT